MTIKGIYGIEPHRDGEYPISYTVGFDGVTRIEQGRYSPEPYCERIFYQVYKGDHLYSVMNDQAVAEIQFMETSND